MPTNPTRIRITLDTLLFLFTVLLALGLRCAFLSADSLGANEARLAVQALNLLNGGGVSLDDTGSVLFTGLSFFLFGDNDLAARLPAALASSATVASVWFLRPWIGNSGSLLSGLLLATSPTISYLSPRLGAAAIAILLILFMAWKVARFAYSDRPERSLLWSIAITLPLLFVLGPIGIAGILLIATYLVVDYFLFDGGLLGGSKLEVRVVGPYLVASLWAVLVLISPAIGGYADARLPGVASFSDLFRMPVSGYGPLLPWARLLAYDLALLLLGVASMVFLLIFHGRGILSRKDSRSAFQRFVLIWIAVATFAVLLSGPGHHSLLVFMLTPLGINTGFLFQRILEDLGLPEWRRYIYRSGVSGALFFCAIISVSIASTVGANQRIDIIMLAAGSPTLMVLALLWPLRSLRSGLANLMLGIFAIGIFMNLHTASFLGSNGNGRELLIQPAVGHNTIKVVRDLAKIGPDVISDKSVSVAVQPSLEYPFEWYLRDAASLSFSTPSGTEDLYLSLTDDNDLRPGYTKISLPYLAGWRSDGLKIKEGIRWLYYREVPPARREVSSLFVWTKRL